jgi:peptide-methionine (S)-S-oxide reductase
MSVDYRIAAPTSTLRKGGAIPSTKLHPNRSSARTQTALFLSEDERRTMPPDPSSNASETAVLGGGCFWCLEAVFNRLEGVQSVESGYAGGDSKDPTYDDVCSGRTGHAEVVRVAFDPAVLSYRDLLRVFFAIHDPTTRDRQGNDIGTQYRSVIFAQNDRQRADAQSVVEELSKEKLWDEPIVTELAGAAPFYPAESYHRQYFERNRNQPYCQFVVAPKVAKFRQQFAGRLRA